MKYIEIKEGLSIKKSEVESVERLDDGGSRIIMRTGKEFDTAFFYQTLLQLLELDHPELTDSDSKIDEVMEKVSTTLNHAQHFAG